MDASQVFDKVAWSTCNVNCGSRCPVRLFVRNGKVVRIETDNTGDSACRSERSGRCVYKCLW